MHTHTHIHMNGRTNVDSYWSCHINGIKYILQTIPDMTSAKDAIASEEQDRVDVKETELGK